VIFFSKNEIILLTKEVFRSPTAAQNTETIERGKNKDVGFSSLLQLKCLLSAFVTRTVPHTNLIAGIARIQQFFVHASQRALLTTNKYPYTQQ
jgi:hypothetical protein